MTANEVFKHKNNVDLKKYLCNLIYIECDEKIGFCYALNLTVKYTHITYRPT